VKRRKGLLDEEKFLPPLPEQLPRGVSSLPGYGQTSPVAQGLLGFTGRQPTYSVMDPQAQQMSDAYRLGEQASVASQLYGSVLPFAAASTMASAQRAGSLLSPLTVFHGSPHKFSKFDASKIGTGEGAQAYGHGIYLAESPDVAKGYQLATSKDRFVTRDGFFDPSQLEHINVRAIVRTGDLDQAIEKARKYALPDDDYPETAAKAARDLAKLESLKASGGITPNTGVFYKADLPDEEIAKMLDWDKPLSQQSRAIQKFALENSKPLAKLVKFQQANKLNENPPKSIYDLSGGELMRELGSPQEVAQKLRDSGIPGVRYLDQGSRGTGKGTSNFVVFPGEESKVRIMEINGKPVVIDEEELRRSGLLGVAQ
jgi:hypothetical protein